jgi:hypothetical protein
VEIKNIEELSLIRRAMGDVWGFGLLMDTGQKIAISQINEIIKDNLGNAWLEAELLENNSLEDYFTSPTSRTTCNINISKICMIYELWDT